MTYVNVSKHCDPLLEFAFPPWGSQYEVSHLEEYKYFYTMQEPWDLDFMMVGYRDTLLCHPWPWHGLKDFIFLQMPLCIMNFLTRRTFPPPIALGIIYLFTSPLLPGDAGIFSVWIQELPLGPHYLNAIYVSCNLPSVYIHISYYKISTSKSTALDTLYCWYCLSGLTTLSTKSWREKES